MMNVKMAIRAWPTQRARGRSFAMHDDSDIGTKPIRVVHYAVIAAVIGDAMDDVLGGEVGSR